MKTTRTITIVCRGGNDYDVFEGENYCDRLCWDEMLGTIAELTHPKIGSASYRMVDADQHQAERERHRVRIEALMDDQQPEEIK